LRSLADNVQHRLWVAVPYVGGWNAVKSVLGLRWRDSDDVRFRLLTDTTNKGWLDRRTIEIMNSHGKVKHLLGLHAKVYIIDNHALVTSANLTDTAFARRREVGVFLSSKQSKEVIRTFEDWWDNEATFPPSDWLKNLTKASHNGSHEEPGKDRPSKLYSLPSPPADRELVSPAFRDYKAFLTSYREFADTYVAVGGRLFPQVPLYIETDMFLNYLFHDDGELSKKYERAKSPRSLTKKQQQAEVKKQSTRFRKWTQIGENHATDKIRRREELRRSHGS
jgi:PLD-like domain